MEDEDPRRSSLYTGRESLEGFGAYNRVARHFSKLGGGAPNAAMIRTKRTWDGVFLPVSLSIFGVVLFTRLPWIVGQCGIWMTLIGIGMCYLVTLLTTISLAAISTNGFTGDGGPYMMVSRCLGPQIGTTVGLTFVLANMVATAMYLVGGVDVVVNVIQTAQLEDWYVNDSYAVTVVCSSIMLLLLLIIASVKVEKVFRVLCLGLTLLSVLDVVVFIIRSPGAPPEGPTAGNHSNVSSTPFATAGVIDTVFASSSSSSQQEIGWLLLNATVTTLRSPMQRLFGVANHTYYTTERKRKDLSFLSSTSSFSSSKESLCPVLDSDGLSRMTTTTMSSSSGGSGAYPIFTGLSRQTWANNWDPKFTQGNSFQSVLSVLFPGVSGLMSGVCLSGDLVNGAKAIPRGIGYAWIASLIAYVTIALLVGASVDRRALVSDFHVLRFTADEYVFPPGLFVASFAAGLSMMVGSSRVLRAIAVDQLLSFRWVKWLCQSSPFRALLIFWGCIQAVLLLGDTYTYASAFATQVFLANFLALNLSTFLSSATGIASFRPVYGFFNTATALGGALVCLVVMFYVNPLVSAGVLTFMIVVLVVTDTYIDPTRVFWGDASQPLFFYVVRKWLLRLDERKEHIRHWRPSILHIVTDPLCSLNLFHVANNVKKGGLYEIGLVVQGNFRDTAHACFRWKGWLMDFITASGIKAFGVVTFGTELRSATQQLLRTAGLGGMHPNTVLISLDEILQREYFNQIYDEYSGTSHGLGIVATTTTTSPAAAGGNRSAAKKGKSNASSAKKKKHNKKSDSKKHKTGDTNENSSSQRLNDSSSGPHDSTAQAPAAGKGSKVANVLASIKRRTASLIHRGSSSEAVDAKKGATSDAASVTPVNGSTPSSLPLAASLGASRRRSSSSSSSSSSGSSSSSDDAPQEESDDLQDATPADFGAVRPLKDVNNRRTEFWDLKRDAKGRLHIKQPHYHGAESKHKKKAAPHQGAASMHLASAADGGATTTDHKHNNKHARAATFDVSSSVGFSSQTNARNDERGKEEKEQTARRAAEGRRAEGERTPTMEVLDPDTHEARILDPTSGYSSTTSSHGQGRRLHRTAPPTQQQQQQQWANFPSFEKVESPTAAASPPPPAVVVHSATNSSSSSRNASSSSSVFAGMGRDAKRSTPHNNHSHPPQHPSHSTRRGSNSHSEVLPHQRRSPDVLYRDERPASPFPAYYGGGGGSTAIPVAASTRSSNRRASLEVPSRNYGPHHPQQQQQEKEPQQYESDEADSLAATMQILQAPSLRHRLSMVRASGSHALPLPSQSQQQFLQSSLRASLNRGDDDDSRHEPHPPEGLHSPPNVSNDTLVYRPGQPSAPVTRKQVRITDDVVIASSPKRPTAPRRLSTSYNQKPMEMNGDDHTTTNNNNNNNNNNANGSFPSSMMMDLESTYVRIQSDEESGGSSSTSSVSYSAIRTANATSTKSTTSPSFVTRGDDEEDEEAAEGEEGGTEPHLSTQDTFVQWLRNGLRRGVVATDGPHHGTEHNNNDEAKGDDRPRRWWPFGTKKKKAEKEPLLSAIVTGDALSSLSTFDDNVPTAATGRRVLSPASNASLQPPTSERFMHIQSTRHRRTVSEALPLPDATDAVSTHNYLVQSVQRAQGERKKKKGPWGWGLFRTGRRHANVQAEERLLERMIAQRHVTRSTADCDICPFADLTEFCGIAKDVAMLQMNLLIARNMDHLDMADLSKRDAMYVDVWIPHHSDATLFLMSYCFSMTSVWRKKGKLRFLSVVPTNDEVEQELDRLNALLKQHRFPGIARVVTLTSALLDCELDSLDDMVALFASQAGRARVLNTLMRREQVLNGGSTSMIFMRVESFAGAEGDDDAAEEWVSNLVTLSNQLPPMLMIAAGGMRCRTEDW